MQKELGEKYWNCIRMFVMQRLDAGCAEERCRKGYVKIVYCAEIRCGNL